MEKSLDITWFWTWVVFLHFCPKILILSDINVLSLIYRVSVPSAVHIIDAPCGSFFDNFPWKKNNSDRFPPLFASPHQSLQIRDVKKSVSFTFDAGWIQILTETLLNCSHKNIEVKKKCKSHYIFFRRLG